MTETEAARMIQGIADWDRAIILYPAGEQSGCRFIGMSAEQCAAMLRHVADELMRQYVPASETIQ